MYYRFIIVIITVLILLAKPYTVSAMFSLTRPLFRTQETALSEVSYSLKNRHPDPFVNEVFSDNILLTVAYMTKNVQSTDQISWERVRASDKSKITLKPGETFAFHDSYFDKYNGRIASTSNAHFNFQDGFRSSGYLVGDGVCHLASFLKVAADRAGLMVEARVPHDFAPIPGVAKVDGVSIYYTPLDKNTSSLQNLYITNNQSKTIAFVFTHKNDALDIKVQELN